MSSIHSRGLRPLTHVVLAALCFTLPACIEDIIIGPPGEDPYSPDGGGGGVLPPLPDSSQAVYYDLLSFAGDIQPQFDAASCGISGCHDRQSQIAGFVLLPAPAPGSDAMWTNLQFATGRVNLGVIPFVAEDTALYRRATDRHAGVAIADPDALRAWLEDASARFRDRPLDRFDSAVFAIQIQPGLDRASCTLAGCHDIAYGAPFGLHAVPAVGSVEMAANLEIVTGMIDLRASRPEDTVFYTRATDNHAGTVLVDEDALALAAWIRDAMDVDAE